MKPFGGKPRVTTKERRAPGGQRQQLSEPMPTKTINTTTRKAAPKAQPIVVRAKPAPLAVIEPPPIQTFNGTFTKDQIELVKRTICNGASDDELHLFISQCQRTQLDPFSRQIYSIERTVSVKNERGQWEYRKQRTIQVGIDGFRLIAERTGKYNGQSETLWCGEDGVWKEVWLGKVAPHAAKVEVYRRDFTKPMVAVAVFDSYAARKDGTLTSMWAKMPEVMIAKCAEALALRKAFPLELSGLYTSEETDFMENAAPVETDATQTAKIEAGGGEVKTINAEVEVVSSTTPKAEKKKDWRQHVNNVVGKANGPLLGAKLGDLNPHLLGFLRYEWYVKMPSKLSAKEKALAEAIEAAVQDGAEFARDEEETPATPAKAVTTPETTQKPAQAAKNATAGTTSGIAEPEKAPLETKPTEWRSRKIEISRAKALFGRELGAIARATLGEIRPADESDAKAKGVCDRADGKFWLRLLATQGVAFLESENTHPAKLQINAIRAAVAELKPFDGTDWLKDLTETELRKEIARRLAEENIDPAKAEVELKDALLDKTFADASPELILHLLVNWPDTLAALEGAK